MYTYYHSHDGYSRRHENRLYNADGTSAPVMLITRYTYKYTWQTNGIAGPRGGKARKQRKKNVFYSGGIFYRAKNVQLEDGRKLNSYETFDGVIFDCFEKSSRRQGVPVVKIELVEGVPVEVKTDTGEVVWSYFENTISELEDMLQIPEQDRAEVEEKATDETEEPTGEQAGPADKLTAWASTNNPTPEQIDAAIECMSRPNEQIDIFAWAIAIDAAA